MIESIELNINDNLIMYLSNGGEPSPDGGGSSFSVVSRRMFNYLLLKTVFDVSHVDVVER